MPTRVIIGWDTEYQEVDPEGLGRPNPLVSKGRARKRGHKTPTQRRHEKFNDVLAYSICVLNPETGAHTSDCVTRSDGEWMDWRNRLNAATLITGAIAKGVAEDIIPADPEGYAVVFCAHFAAADVPALRDFEEITQGKGAFVSTLRKTYASRANPGVRHVRIPGVGHNVKLSIKLCDTILWVPATHRSISKIGKELGLEKIALPPGAIENMKSLLADDPALFREYAIRDAEVAALYAHRFLSFCEDVLDLGDRPPVTASGAGVRFALNQLKASGIPADIVFGTDKKGAPIPGAEMVLAMGAECFHGARNETFWLGPTPEGQRLYDWDLPSCYLTTLSMVGLPDWQASYATTDLDALAVIDDALTYACVRFDFPKDVRFPCLPVRGADADGLFFPRKGMSWCTGPELVVARNLGATIEVIEGRVLPHNPDAFRPFHVVLQLLQNIRTSEQQAGRKGSLNERLAKEIANSMYGQVARAVAGMRVGGRPMQTLNLQTGDREQLTPSRVSSAPVASFVTGIARACVSELINDLPRDALVVSVTTDGYLTSAETVDNFGPVTRAFMNARELLVPGDGCLELKHTCDRALSVRTRGAFSIEGDRSKSPLMARAGNRMDEDDLADLVARDLGSAESQWAENDYWTAKAVEREYGDKVSRARLRSIMEQWQLRGGDLTRKELEVSIALEFDHKRRILPPQTEWRGLVGCPTEPWETVAEAFETRHKFSNWRHKHKRVLKTREDHDDFAAYANFTWRASGDATLRLVALQFAVVRGTHGLPERLDVGYRTAAEIMTNAGFPTHREQLRRRARDHRTAPPPAPQDVTSLKEASGIFIPMGRPDSPIKESGFDMQKQQLNGYLNRWVARATGEGGCDPTHPHQNIRPIDVRKAAGNLGIKRRELDAAMKKAIGSKIGPTVTMMNVLEELAFGPEPGPEVIEVLRDFVFDAAKTRINKGET